MRRYLEEQRNRSFDLLSPPLMRVALMRTVDDEWELVWSYHHLLLDGWSISLVLQDVLIRYDAVLQGHAVALPRRRPHRDYIAWLHRQDLAAAKAYCRGTLADVTSPHPAADGSAAGRRLSRAARTGRSFGCCPLPVRARSRRLVSSAG